MVKRDWLPVVGGMVMCPLRSELVEVERCWACRQGAASPRAGGRSEIWCAVSGKMADKDVLRQRAEAGN
ncbi:MAG: hypothetical protein OEM94_02310 [Acidimicrobiia bacterium]|nr:hypothetical protein [Acidimicrobiia bacterium]